MQTEQPSIDLLTEEELHVRASTGKRLANYLIDLVVFYLLVIVFGIAIFFISPAAADFFNDDNTGGILDRIITLLLYAVYMSIVETIFKGKSIGKFITKTKAVNIDGSQITSTTAFARGFSRAVPFCVLSAFGTPCNPWQDRWSNTMVVDEKNRL